MFVCVFILGEIKEPLYVLHATRTCVNLKKEVLGGTRLQRLTIICVQEHASV